MGLASAAAHAHYVNGMVGGRGDGHHYPAAALHAAAAAAAAAASSAAAAQRAEIEREEVDRDRGKLLFGHLIKIKLIFPDLIYV